MRLHLIPNSHIDPVWLWDKHEGIDEVLNTFRSACDRLDEYPDLTFAASSLQFYEWVLQLDEALFRRIVQKVQEDRWEIVGGWWVEADTNLPLEESFIKHAELSQDFTRKHFDREIAVAFLPDSFGHPATLPKILASTGFKYLVFCRPGEHEKTLPANLFQWEYEEYRILAYRLKHHYTQCFDYDRVPEMLNDKEYDSSPANCFFFGVGDHGGGPSIVEIERFNEFIATRPPGDAGYSTCLSFFEEAANGTDIPVYNGDLHMHAVGCYSVLHNLKDAVRRCENSLQFASRALDINGDSNSCLIAPWKTTLFNQFHDIMPGSCSPVAARQAEDELGGAFSSCIDTAYRALKSVSQANPPSAKDGEFRIFNTLPFEVTVPLHIESFGYYKPDAVFRDEQGRAITIQEVLPSVRCCNRRWEFIDSIPPQQFKSYYFDGTSSVERADPEAAHFQLLDEQCHAENTFIANLSTGNVLTSLIDASLDFLVLDDQSDTWGHGVERYDAVEGAFQVQALSYHSGPVADRLHQQWSYGNSTLQALFSVYKHLPGVYVDLLSNWREERKILKMEICPDSAIASTFTMQGAGGHITRQTDGKELPMHHWVWIPASQGGLAVVQDGAFACDCTTERLRLTFIRSSLYGYHDPYQLSPADPQRLTDQGEHRMRLHLQSIADFNAESLARSSLAFIEPYPVIRECGSTNT